MRTITDVLYFRGPYTFPMLVREQPGVLEAPGAYIQTLLVDGREIVTHTGVATVNLLEDQWRRYSEIISGMRDIRSESGRPIRSTRSKRGSIGRSCELVRQAFAYTRRCRLYCAIPRDSKYLGDTEETLLHSLKPLDTTQRILTKLAKHPYHIFYRSEASELLNILARKCIGPIGRWEPET